MPRYDHFEEFKDHTRLKHLLLETYVKQWATVLLRGGFRRVWFIDAFAGAGQDAAGQPGSPVIAAQITQAINAEHFGAAMSPRVGMRTVAIEWHEERFQHLKETLAAFTDSDPHRTVIVRHGQLADFVDKLLEYVGSDACLFFLDPFGIDGLDAALLARLLDGPHNELLVLFSDEGAVRLHGKTVAVPPSMDEEVARARETKSLFGEEDDRAIEMATRMAVERCLRGHASSANAKSILDRAFGGDFWQSEISATDIDRRQSRFVELYEEVLRNAGATHVLRFSVDTDRGRHKYFLLHATKDKAGFRTMKEAMYRARRAHGTEPENLLAEYTSETDIDAVVSALAARFAGREGVRWQSDAFQEETVQKVALEETPLLRGEIVALKAALIARGWYLRKANGKQDIPLRFNFPHADA